MRWFSYVTLPVFLLGVMLWAVLATEQGLRMALALSSPLWENHVSLRKFEGSLKGPLKITGLKIKTPAADIDVGAAQLDWSMRALFYGEIRVGYIDIQQLQVQQKDSAEQAPPAESQPLENIELPIIKLGRIDLRDLAIQQPDGSESIALNQIRLQAETTADRISIHKFLLDWEETGILEARADLNIAQSQFVIDQMVVEHQSRPTRLALIGWLDYVSLESDLRLDWKALGWPLQDPEALQDSNGFIEFSGLPDAWVVSAGSDLKTADEQFGSGRVALQARGNLESATIGKIEWTAPAITTSARGDLAWGKKTAGQFDVQIKKLDTAAIGDNLPGNVSGQFHSDFSVTDRGWQAQLSKLNLAGNWLEKELLITGALEANPNLVTLKTINLISGESRITASGTLPGPDQLDRQAMNISAQVNSPNLAELLPGAQGVATLDAAISGLLKKPVARITGDVNNFAIAKNRIEQAQIAAKIDFSSGVAASQKLNLEAKAQNLNLSGRVFARANVSLDGSLAEHRLKLVVDQKTNDDEQARRTASDDALQLALVGSAKTQSAAPSWTFQLNQLALNSDETGQWSLRNTNTQGSVSQHGINLSEACLQSPNRAVVSSDKNLRDSICLTAKVRKKTAKKPKTQVFDVTLGEMDFERWQTLLPDDTRLQGSLAGQARLEIDSTKKLRASAKFETTEIDLSVRNQNKKGSRYLQVAEFAAGEVNVELVDQLATALVNLPLKEFSDRGLRLEGRLDLPESDVKDFAAASRIDAKLRIYLPKLDWIAALIPEIVDMDGEFVGDYQISGTLAQPELVGELALKDGAVEIDQPGIRIEPLQLKIYSDQSDRIRVSGSAKSGGELTFEGEYNLGKQTVDVSVAGEQFTVADVPEATVAISPDVKVALDLTARTGQVNGTLAVPKARLMPTDVKSSGAITATDDEVLLNQETPSGKPWAISSNLQLVVGPDVKFEGFGLTGNFVGALKVKQAAGQAATGSGELRIENGHYKAYGQDLAIKQGRIIFAGGLVTDPGLDVKAQRQPAEDITVGLRVTGPLRKPRFELFSQPSMAQTETLSWLILGRAPDDSAEAGGAALTQAALALGLKGGNFLAKEVGSRLGVDEVGIESRPGSKADQAALVLGKYLNPDLYVSYGVGLFEPIYSLRVRYRLSRRWTLQTESGIHSGGDFIYSIERD